MSKIIDLKPGISIEFKKKFYTHKTGIPEDIMKERCNVLKDGKSDERESKKLFDAQVKKFKFVPEKADVAQDTSK